MTKPDQYYFSDSIFQLELNLHNIRRELILMIEEFEREDCFSCLQLKCRCVVKSPGKNCSFAGHIDSGKNSKENALNEAPPAVFLPKPKFEEVPAISKEGNNDIEAWIEASRTVHKARTDGPLPNNVLLALRKSWTESRNDISKDILDDFKKERILLDTHYAANAVEVFFNSFKVQPAVTAANLAYVTNVAAIYGNRKSRGSEYTYF